MSRYRHADQTDRERIEDIKETLQLAIPEDPAWWNFGDVNLEAELQKELKQLKDKIARIGLITKI